MNLSCYTTIASLFFFVAASLGWASEKPVSKTASRRTASASLDRPLPNLVADVPFVLVPVHVTTMLGGPMMQLESKDFHLFDQFDSSGSMRTKMNKSADAT